MTYVSVGDHYSISGEWSLAEQIDENCEISFSFRIISPVPDTRGSSLAPTGDNTKFNISPYMEIMCNRSRKTGLDSTNTDVIKFLLGYNEISTDPTLDEISPVKQINLFSYLCYRDVLGRTYIQYLGSNRSITKESIRDEIPIVHGSQSRPEGLREHVLEAYVDWLGRDSTDNLYVIQKP
jgi:hypothetical protein